MVNKTQQMSSIHIHVTQNEQMSKRKGLYWFSVEWVNLFVWHLSQYELLQFKLS